MLALLLRARATVDTKKIRHSQNTYTRSNIHALFCTPWENTVNRSRPAIDTHLHDTYSHAEDQPWHTAYIYPFYAYEFNNIEHMLCPANVLVKLKSQASWDETVRSYKYELPFGTVQRSHNSAESIRLLAPSQTS